MVSAGKQQEFGMHYIKTGILLFWGVWFLFAFLSNTFDFFSALERMPQNWHFRSGNYALVQNVIKVYGLSPAWGFFFFLGDIFIQAWSSVLFVVASVALCRCNNMAWRWINIAFAVSMTLWAVFILMDEFFIAYNYEGAHSGLFTFELISLMAIHLLPDSK